MTGVATRRRWAAVGAAIVAALAVAVPAGPAVATPTTTAAVRPVPTPQIRGIFSDPSQYQWCHAEKTTKGVVDYAFNTDIQRMSRAAVAAFVARFDRCMPAGVTKVYVRYLHEGNGPWFWDRPRPRTAAEFRRDFCTMKRYVLTRVRPSTARRIVWVLGLNWNTPRDRGKTADYYTPCADVIGVSMYERHPSEGMTMQELIDHPRSGMRWWTWFAKARKCGAATATPTAAQLRRLKPCRLAFSEWGARTVAGYYAMKRFQNANGVLYGAYLYAPGVLDWIEQPDLPPAEEPPGPDNRP